MPKYVVKPIFEYSVERWGDNQEYPMPVVTMRCVLAGEPQIDMARSAAFHEAMRMARATGGEARETDDE